ncbi:MAG: type IV pilus secretin PilQ [Deltaproteobacteria bacterium]|nr:type IV pilus secretin PilQ [Deltaproteobacteria bacterium]
MPLKLTQASPGNGDTEGKTARQASEAITPGEPEVIPGFLKKAYTGTPMTMDFVNADVTNVLRLIAEVSNLNIVWGPEVQGTVSMRLKNVPWDQALDLILANNNLAKRESGNVVWITTRAQMAQIEAEEKRKRKEYEAEKKRREEEELRLKEKKKKLAPIETAYIGVDFASVDDIKSHIEAILTERGKVSVDNRTSTVIVQDIKPVIEKAKELAEKFDTPVKQVMIEARIVDATTDFARDLGIKWDKFQFQNRNSLDALFASFGGTPGSVTPTDPNPDDATIQWPHGGKLYSPTFTSPAPSTWSPNMGLAFANLSALGYTATILDAKLALAETEGKSRTISAPKVLASNGEKAVISRGDTFYLQAAENVEPKEVVATLRLEVTPVVSYNNYITMKIALKDEQQTGLSSKTGKELETQLMVKSGETIVIGGIYTEDSSLHEGGIPGLRRIPILGWLFNARKKTTQKTELLIFLTPTVVTNQT